MSIEDIWRVASELNHSYGLNAKHVALENAARAETRNEKYQMEDWLAIASRTEVLSSLCIS